MALTSKLISGSRPNAETLAEIQRVMQLPPNKTINLLVFETKIKNKTVYCCCSGGAVIDGELRFTFIGRAALESLVNLPLGNQDRDVIIFQELKMGPTPLKDKVKAAVMKAPEGAKICFFGDMQGELDGHMLKAMRLTGETINV